MEMSVITSILSFQRSTAVQTESLSQWGFKPWTSYLVITLDCRWLRIDDFIEKKVIMIKDLD